ncbi:MAG: alpha/beta hydrolase domain-containing protein [Bauldia sp.]
MHPSRLALIGAVTALALAGRAEARITRIEIAKTEAAFGGATFAPTGPYERLVGKAYGEVDPRLPQNAVIQDIALAPRNARGMVEYVTDIDILRPADRAKSNGILFFNIVNRGNKGGLTLYNFGATGAANDVASAGDGFMQRKGYTIVWFGWQPDVLPGNGRMGMTVPVARNPDGSAITGNVRSELLSQTPTTTLNLSSGWFTGLATAAYPSVTTDNKAPLADGFLPVLTVRHKENDPRIVVPNSEWSFASCPAGAAPTPSANQICMPAGFKVGQLYELTYRAKDPLVLGLGFAAGRDLGAFLKSAERDDAGNANPVLVKSAQAIVMGSSQSGRYIRSLINLGFNQDETGKLVFEGAFPHIGGGLMPLNVRWGQPGRAITEQVDHLFPGAEFPFTYGSQTDPLTGRTAGILDRCTATNTCPKIVHAATALEVWELRQSLGFTDPLGIRDIADPPNVRSYIMASTQHGAAGLPLPTQAPFGTCQQQSNPNPHTWTVRALLEHLRAWVQDNASPPPSNRPTIAAGDLVAADQVRFPVIPANKYGGVARPAVKFLGLYDPLHPQDFGKDFDPLTTSGILPGEPPKVGTGRYGNLVPQVDADGNDIGGIRDVFIQVPIGTYTGWNLFNANSYEDGFCTLQGSFVPFAATKAERLAVGDLRLSLEERYPTKDAYVTAFRAAADNLVKQGFLLPEDAALLVKQAEDQGVRSAP